MVEIKVLNHSVVIKGKSFEECKAEYDRIWAGVKKRLFHTMQFKGFDIF